jgi:hypothetical protein
VSQLSSIHGQVRAVEFWKFGAETFSFPVAFSWSFQLLLSAGTRT